MVRFQGNVDFSQDSYIGLELEKKHYNGNDGQAYGTKYFNVKKKRGYFAKKTAIARILTSSGAKSLKQMKKLKSLTDFPKLGDKVRTAKGKSGVVRYVGSTSFANGILIGWNWINGGPMAMMGRSKTSDTSNARQAVAISRACHTW